MIEPYIYRATKPKVVGHKARTIRSEINVSRLLFDSPSDSSSESNNFSEIENQICHLKTFSILSHRRYAKMLYKKIIKQVSITKNNNKKSALNKLANIIELKINQAV